MGAQLSELCIHKMKHYATIMHEVEEAYGLRWKDVYNILYSDERESDKIMLLETNFMTNVKQPFNKYWAAEQDHISLFVEKLGKYIF